MTESVAQSSPRPAYGGVFAAFLRNSLIRDMTFRLNFLIECLSSLSWTAMNFGFYLLIYEYTPQIGPESGWGKYEFFVFLSTTWFINSLVQAFFMPNCQEFSELIRTGNLDFALLKPIDTQFLVSLHKVDWSALSNFLVGGLLLAYSLVQLSHGGSVVIDQPAIAGSAADWAAATVVEATSGAGSVRSAAGLAAAVRTTPPLELSPLTLVLYPLYILCGVAILYSLMISLAATSIWLGRNQSLYNFWFYITNFSRYPMEIYQRGPWGWSLWGVFTFAIPVLVVVNVPARLLAQPLHPRQPWEWWLAGFALLATVMSLTVSRWVFVRALGSYRSASS